MALSQEELKQIRAYCSDDVAFRQIVNTVEQAMTRERTRFQRIIDALPVRLFWKNLRSIYGGGNQHFARDVGLTTTEILGKDDSHLPWREGDAALRRQVDRDVMLNGRAQLHVIEKQRIDGQSVWIDTNTLPLRDESGNVMGVVGMYEDISPRIEEERALRDASRHLKTINAEVRRQAARLRQTLENERELARRLEEALAREADLLQFKSQIIDTASHEFRTPLGIISMSLEILEYRYEQLSAEKRDHYFQQIRSQMFYLTDMLQDIFIVNDARAMPVDMRVISFDTLVEQLTHHLMNQFSYTHEVSIEFAPDERMVFTDIELLNQVLVNLVSNALKFNVANRPIRVLMQCHQTIASISVVDQGIGIPAEEQPHVWDMFYRSSNIETRRGLGLGLTIVKKLCDILGASAAVFSAGVNQGSTFTVSIPLKEDSTRLEVAESMLEV